MNQSNGNGHQRYKPDAARAARYDALHEVLDRLPLRDRQLIDAIYWKGQTQVQAGRQQGIKQPSIHERHTRVLRDIGRQLRDWPAALTPQEASTFEATILRLAKRLARASARRNLKPYPPLPGYIRGRSWHKTRDLSDRGRGWGAPTWTCGLCRTVYQVRDRRKCGCRGLALAA